MQSCSLVFCALLRDALYECFCNGGLLALQSDLVSPPPPSLPLISLSSSCRAGNLLMHTVNDGAVQICALRDARQVHVVRTTPLREIFNPHFDVNKSGISTVSIFFIELVSLAVQSRISNAKCGKRERCILLCSQCVLVGGCLLSQHEITTYYQDGNEKRNCTVTK